MRKKDLLGYKIILVGECRNTEGKSACGWRLGTAAKNGVRNERNDLRTVCVRATCEWSEGVRHRSPQ